MIPSIRSIQALTLNGLRIADASLRRGQILEQNLSNTNLGLSRKRSRLSAGCGFPRVVAGKPLNFKGAMAEWSKAGVY